MMVKKVKQWLALRKLQKNFCMETRQGRRAYERAKIKLIAKMS